MANDLAYLKPRLATALRDPDMEVWEEDELTDLLTWGAARLYPRVARPISAPIYPMAADEEDYDLPAGIMEISRIDIGKVADDSLVMPMPPGTWEIQGDVWSGTAALFINRYYSNPDRYLIVHGYGTYDLVDDLPPDIYVPFIMAHAGAEAIRRMLPDRARFEKWAKRNQKENISVNELGQMLAQFEGQVERLRSQMFTWRKPKPAR